MANYDLGTVGFTIQNTGAEETASDVNMVIQAIQRAEKQFESLQQAMSKGKLTHEQYQRGVQQTQSTIDRLNRVLDNQASAVDQQAFAFNRAGRGMNQFGFYAQQVGYQVGDFFVQVQSGTNFLVAFGQQATQLAGLIPGVLGAALGIGISAVTALGGALFRTSESARTFQDALNSVNDVLSETSSLVKIANGDFSELEERFGGLSPAIRALAEARADVSIRQMADSAKALRDELNELYNGNAWLNVSRAEDLSNAFQLNTRESRALTDAMNDLARQDTLSGQVESATQLRELLLQMFGPVKDMTSEQFNFYLQVLQTEEAYRELLNRTGEVSGEVSLLSSMMDLFTDAANSAASAVNGIKTASDSALTSVTNLAAKMWEAAQARLAAMQAVESMQVGGVGSGGGAAYLASQYALYGQGRVAGNRAATESGSLFTPFPIPEETSGGGRGADPLESLINQLQTEQETLQNWYTTSQEMLQSASDAELEILGGKYEAMARLDEEYRQRAFEAQQAQAQMSFQAYSGMFSALGDLLSVFGNESKGAAIAALAIQKGLAVAQIVVSTAAAQMRAFAELGPIAGAAMAAKIGVLGKIQAGLVIATGIAQAANIGRGTVGGVGSTRGSATVSTQASAPTPQTVMIDSIDPDSLYSGQTLINLFDAFYDENDKRGKVFVVAR